MAYQGEPLRTKGVPRTLHRLDALRLRYGILERQELALRALELLLRHQDWIPEEVAEVAADQWAMIARETTSNVSDALELSLPREEDPDDLPF